MESKILLALKDLLLQAGLSTPLATILMSLITLLTAVLIAWIADWLTKKIILSLIHAMAAKSKTLWDDILVEKKFFHRLAHFVPTFILYQLSGEAFKGLPAALDVFQTAVKAYAVLLTLLVIDAFLNSLLGIYNTLPNAKNRSIKGFIQVVKIIFYVIGSIVILSVIFRKDLTYFFTGMGAMAAVLMLVFKDFILGFVGGVQLASNDMVRLGDWIEMPSRNADGSVIDISLTTVKVQNADMTITTIPTYALVAESFYNWRGMEESGGRRIKRSVNIDMKSIHFLDAAMLDSFRQNPLLKAFFDSTGQELPAKEKGVAGSKTETGLDSQITNLSVFRKYLEYYLRNHPQLHKDMTLLVRHRQPTQYGLPIEIYAFSKEKRLIQYETIQSDIFDHILAIIPDFRLSVFQTLGGDVNLFAGSE